MSKVELFCTNCGIYVENGCQCNESIQDINALRREAYLKGKIDSLVEYNKHNSSPTGSDYEEGYKIGRIDGRKEKVLAHHVYNEGKDSVLSDCNAEYARGFKDALKIKELKEKKYIGN